MSQFVPMTPPRRGSSSPTADKTFVGKYQDQEKSMQTPPSLDGKVEEPATVDRFTRTVLEETFGTGFSKQGFTKTGTKTGLVESSSPAVKEKWVRAKNNDQIDQRCTAVKQGLVKVDEVGDVIKGESILCKTQIEFTPSGKVSKSSAAVKSGLVKLAPDGSIDQKSEAVEKGWLQLDKQGSILEAESALCQKLFLKETNGSHIHGFEVAHQITKLGGLQYTKEEAGRMVLAINEDRNVYMKTREGNMTGAISAPEGSGDLSLDREIVAALSLASSGESVSLQKNVADRAVRVAHKILDGDYPVEFKETARKLFTQLKDENGHKIVRSNAKLTTPDGADTYNVTVQTKAPKDSAAASVAKNLSGAFDDAAPASPGKKIHTQTGSVQQPGKAATSERQRGQQAERDHQVEPRELQQKERAAQRQREQEAQQRQNEKRRVDEAQERGRVADAEERKQETARQQQRAQEEAAAERRRQSERAAAQQRQQEEAAAERRRQSERLAAQQRQQEEAAAERRRQSERAAAQQRQQEEAAAERRRQSERAAAQQRQQEEAAAERRRQSERQVEQERARERERQSYTSSYRSPQPSYYNPYAQYSSYSPYSYSSPSSIYSGSFSGSYYSSGGSANGSALFTGPRGGTYYVNSNGNKTYV